MKIVAALLFGLSIATNVVADSASPKPGGVVEYNYSTSNNPALFGMEYKSPKDAYNAVSNKKGVTKFEEGDIEGFADIETAILWVFTNDKNPAHPAVMKLKAFEANGNLYMMNKVLCGAGKAACDSFVSYQSNLANSVIALYRLQNEKPNNGRKGDSQKQRSP